MTARSAAIARLRAAAVAEPVVYPNPGRLPRLVEVGGVFLGLTLDVDPERWFWTASVGMRVGGRPSPPAGWGPGTMALANRALAEVLDGLGDPLTDEAVLMPHCLVRHRGARPEECRVPEAGRAH